MNPEQWHRVSAALDRALDLDEPARRDFLHKLRAEDAELCREVASLLEHEGSLDNLEKPPAGLLEEAVNLTRTDPATVLGAPPSRAFPNIPGYEVLREIARGGQSVVYQARQISLNRLVALKTILAGSAAAAEERARFVREAEAVAQLKHPHIVQIYDVGALEGEAYLALEFVGGGTLSRKISGKPQPPGEAAALVETLARAMHAAHQHGIIHRDLKPGNILLTEDGGPKIADFGLAKHQQADATLTQTGQIMGTPAYMAPEQAAGKTSEIGVPADVYALGVILYEMLIGRPPFAGQATWQTVESVLHAEPVPPRRLGLPVPRDLETICLKCLRKEPHARYASAAELADDLQRFLAGQPIEARPVGTMRRLVMWCRRKPALAATIAVAILAVAIVGGVGFHQVIQEREHFREERDRAQANLYRALVGEARALMQGRDTGWWWKAMDNIRQASALNIADRDPTELREVAIQCMGTEHACMRLHATWEGHTAAITCSAFSPDGRFVASGSNDQTIRLWSVPDGKPVAVLSGHRGNVTGVSFHPGGAWLASSSADGSIRLWDVASLPPQPVAQIMELKAGAVNGLEWSADGAWLAAACQDGAVRVFAAPKGKVIDHAPRHVLIGHTARVTCLAISDSGLLASGGQDRTIRTWDLTTGKQRDTWSVGSTVSTMAFDRSGTTLSWGEIEQYRLMSMNLAQMTGGGFADHFNTVQQVRAFGRPSREARRQRYLTASADGTVKMWRAGISAESAVARGDGGSANTVAINADQTWVAVGHADGRLRFWELAKPKERAFVEQNTGQCACFVGPERLLFSPGLLADFSGGVDGVAAKTFGPAASTALALDPKDRWFAYADKGGALSIANLKRPDEVIRCAGHPLAIADLATELDGDRFASASVDGTVKIWNWSSGICEQTVTPKLGPLHKLALTADRHFLAITGARGVAVCELHNQAKVRPVRQQEMSASCVAVFGDWLAFSGPQDTVEVCELSTGRKLHSLRGHTRQIAALAFSPDGKVLASGSANAVLLWDTTRDFAQKEAIPFPAGRWDLVPFLTFDPKGDYLLGGFFAPIRIWDMRTPTPTATALIDGSHQCVCFTAGAKVFLAGTVGGTVEQWNIAAIEEAHAQAMGKGKLPPATFARVFSTPKMLVHGGHTGAVWGVAASPDGRWLATGSHDQTVKLWDVASRKLVRTLGGFDDLIWPVAFSPDSRYLAGGSEEKGSGVIKIWEVATGREHQDFRGHRRQVFGLAYHPSRPLMASSSADGSVYLWDLAAGKSLGLLHQFDRAIYTVAFHPDGKWLAASCMDNRVALWDISETPSGPASRVPTRYLEGHTGSVYSVGFSPDGRYLASGSEQGNMILWDGQNFAKVTRLKADTGQIRSISFSRDGQLLSAAAYVNHTVVWDLGRVRRTLAGMNLEW